MTGYRTAMCRFQAAAQSNAAVDKNQCFTLVSSVHCRSSATYLSGLTRIEHGEVDMSKHLYSIAEAHTKTVSPALIARITAHIRAYEDFCTHCDMQEQGEIAFKTAFSGKLYAGSWGTSYEMKHGSEWVKEQLSSEVAWHRGKLKAALGHLDPEIFTICLLYTSPSPRD